MPHGWSSADAHWFIHGRAPFSSCFSPSISFLRATALSGDLGRVRRAHATGGLQL